MQIFSSFLQPCNFYAKKCSFYDFALTFLKHFF